MRDGINLADLDIPAVALVTEDFWPQGNFMAASLGMPDLPRICLPHPLAGTGDENLRAVARQVIDDILDALEGNDA